MEETPGSSRTFISPWEHFEKQSKTAAICQKCKKELKTPNYGTQGLIKHLKSVHGMTKVLIDESSETVNDDKKAIESHKRKAESSEQRKMAKLKKVVLQQKQSESPFSGEIEDNSFDEGDSVDANDHGRSAIKLEQYELNPENGHMEFILVPGQPTTSELSKEEKFIQSVYPQFNGKTKLQLIDQIVILQEKVKTYESTINRLINN